MTKKNILVTSYLDAKNYGVVEGIVLNKIEYLTDVQRDNDTSIEQDGKTYVQISIQTLVRLIPITTKQMRLILAKLIHHGVLLKTKSNPNKYHVLRP